MNFVQGGPTMGHYKKVICEKKKIDSNIMGTGDCYKIKLLLYIQGYLRLSWGIGYIGFS